ncbi:MAG: shikimate kinase [Methylacidiphilales bacterium]|nr:shikimate kinase [Candidatus Methylacidiphilales bacterium]
MARHVTLIGMMGAGKSSVAPRLADRLGRRAIEIDELIEKKEGMTIGEIFIAKGEAYFRRVECELIREVIKQPPAVLSLGGGAFQWEATRKLLLAETVVIYLAATLEVLCSRLQAGINARPLLNAPGIDFRQTVHDLLERRDANYGLAHYRVETDSHTPDDVAKAIITLREAYE